jgi:hypothetical protein
VSYVPVVTAFASSQTCDLDTVGISGCPVDLFTALGHPDQRNPVLGLEARFVPGSSGEGAVLNDWQVRYSCKAAE